MCVPYVKNVFSRTSEIFFSLGLKLLRLFGRDQMSQLNNEVYSNIFSAIEVLGMYLPRVKRYFQPQR